MPVGFTTDEQSYYYKKNAQGDVVAILDSNGVELAIYVYDAWGSITAITGDEQLAESNPFRYRGYYQDNESGFFYLQSRYYDSVVGRFLNADDVSIMIASNGVLLYGNLFAYVANNPILYVDPIGEAFVIAGIVLTLGAVIALVALLGFALLYTFDSNFRNAINLFITNLISGVINVFTKAVDLVVSAVKEVVTTAKRYAKRSGKANHHIVAQSDSRASDSRYILSQHGISVNDSINLVYLNTLLHMFLHTSSYHFSIEMLLRASINNVNNKSQRKARIYASLITVKVILRGFSSILE